MARDERSGSAHLHITRKGNHYTALHDGPLGKKQNNAKSRKQIKQHAVMKADDRERCSKSRRHRTQNNNNNRGTPRDLGDEDSWRGAPK